MSPRNAGAVRPPFIRNKGGRVLFGPSEIGGVMGGGVFAESTLTIPRQQLNEKSARREPNSETASGTRKSNNVARRGAFNGLLCCYRSPSLPRLRNLLLLYSTIAFTAEAADRYPGREKASNCGLKMRTLEEKAFLIDKMIRLPSAEWIETNVTKGVLTLKKGQRGCATAEALVNELLEFADTDGLHVPRGSFTWHLLQDIFNGAVDKKLSQRGWFARARGWFTRRRVFTGDMEFLNCPKTSPEWLFVMEIDLSYADREKICGDMQTAGYPNFSAITLAEQDAWAAAQRERLASPQGHLRSGS